MTDVVIRQLSDRTVCRIAAGEVVERPAGAVKELLENAIDAGATRLDITLVDGGKTLLSVTDNGHGIPAAQLPMALARHATSKLRQTESGDDDWWTIQTLGFRGEALASLAAVSQLTLTSRTATADSAWCINADYGLIREIEPAAGVVVGTRVVVRHLFAAIPARAAFLRSSRAETQAILDTVRAVAGATPDVAFYVDDGSKSLFSAPIQPHNSLAARLNAVVAPDFIDNACEILLDTPPARVFGYAALPTYSRGTASAQYFFVNGRRVRDKHFIGALKASYRPFLEKDRHPVVALYLEIPPSWVDCNVHPAKAEVRFKDPDTVRGLLIKALQNGLSGGAHRTAPAVAQRALHVLHNNVPAALQTMATLQGSANLGVTPVYEAPAYEVAEPRPVFAPVAAPVPVMLPQPAPQLPSTPPIPPLGYAKAQLHRTYIVSQTADGLVLIDQHAAHERLTLHTLQQQWHAAKQSRQVLLLPVAVPLSSHAIAAIEHALPNPTQAGFVFDIMPATLVVREIPTLLPANICLITLWQTFAEQLLAQPHTTPPAAQIIDDLLANCACKASIKAGRALSIDEMNALLRQMEQTPYAGQCNHGRPTMIHLSLKEIEKLFSRR